MTDTRRPRRTARPQAVSLQRALPCLLAGALACALVGCDDSSLEFLADDGSQEARLEEARLAMDDANYERAAEILQSLHTRYPGNAEVTAYLGSALAAVAGLDTFSVLEILDDTGDNNYSELEIVGRVLGDNTGILSAGQVAEKLALLAQATALMRSIDLPNNDQRVQAGLFAVNHAVMTVAQFIMSDQNLATINLSVLGISQLYAGLQVDLESVRGADVLLAGLALDVVALAEAVLAIGDITGELDDNDLGGLFDELQGALDPDLNGSVSLTEVEAYINGI